MLFDVIRSHFAERSRTRSLLHDAIVWALTLSGVAMLPDVVRGQECLYVLNQLENSVAMIRRSTNQFVNRLEMPNDDCPTEPCRPMPTSIEFSAGTGRAYVTRQDVNLVYVLDPVGLTIADTVTVESAGSSAAALSPDGSRLYVTNLAIDSVSVISTSSNEVVDTIDVGPEPPLRARPRAVVVTPDGTRVLVSNSSSDTVSVIRAADGVVTDALPVGDGPAGIAVAPNGARAYVNSANSGEVLTIDLGSLSVDDMIDVGQGPYGIDLTPNGASAFVTNTLDGTVSVIDAASGSVSGDPIAVGAGPIAVAISDDGATAYVANLMDGTVSVIDTASRSVETIDDVPAPFDLAFGPCPPQAIGCTGDCDGGGTVTINELITGVNIVLGSRVLEVCPAFDSDNDDQVNIAELIQAVNNVLGGCPS
jgi:YVTN family beta-propeller protein